MVAMMRVAGGEARAVVVALLVVLGRRLRRGDGVVALGVVAAIALLLSGCGRVWGSWSESGPDGSKPAAVVLDGQLVPGGEGVSPELVIFLPGWVVEAREPLVIEREGGLRVSVEVGVRGTAVVSDQ